MQEDDEGLKLKVALLGLVVVAKNIIAGIQERRRFLDLRPTGGIQVNEILIQPRNGVPFVFAANIFPSIFLCCIVQYTAKIKKVQPTGKLRLASRQES